MKNNINLYSVVSLFDTVNGRTLGMVTKITQRSIYVFDAHTNKNERYNKSFGMIEPNHSTTGWNKFIENY